MYSKDRTTIVDRREMLRVKLKSLAAEARIIRLEELRTHGDLRRELRDHRKGTVGYEARATHLAYGFIRGRTLEAMEPRRYVGMPKWLADECDRQLFERVRAMTKKYGPAGFIEPECMRTELRKAA